jgi:hypothetical protein
MPGAGRLEKVVRPFQSPTAGQARRIPSEQAQAQEIVVLRIGRNGAGKSFQGAYSLEVTYYCDAHRNEMRYTDLPP